MTWAAQWSSAWTGESQRVGPKGYVHGWIFVGAPGIGADVFHPHHGHGVITDSKGGRVSVKFDGGAAHEFEHAGGTGPGRLEPRRPPPALGTPEHDKYIADAAEANAKGLAFGMAKSQAGRTWIHEATGLPTDLVTKLGSHATGDPTVIATADKFFHEGDLARAATLIEAEAEKRRNAKFQRDIKAADQLEAVAKRLRAAKVKDVPPPLGQVGRNADGSLSVVDNQGIRYVVRLSADRKTVTVTGPGGTVSGPANGNPTAAARKLAYEVQGAKRPSAKSSAPATRSARWSEGWRFNPYHGKPGSGHGGQFTSSSGSSSGATKQAKPAGHASHPAAAGAGSHAGRRRQLVAMIHADEAKIRSLEHQLHVEHQLAKTAASQAAHHKAQAAAAKKAGKTAAHKHHVSHHHTHHKHATSHRRRVAELQARIGELRHQVKTLRQQVAKL